ncbi:MAG: tetratricopeptide (TPR) repeat protein [Maricaulis sp.]|jgi:tetratricopeptide (TPR) repeat protein
MRLLTVIALFLITASARADMDQARQAFALGRWQEAASQAQQAGGAEGYAYAARALVAQLMIEPDNPDREALTREAVDLAEAALRADGESAEARLRLAISLGYQGRFKSTMQNLFMRVPQRGRNLLDSVVMDDPGNVWALGTLGAWNLEVARRGGARGMQMLGASIEAGTGFYSQAIALDPDNPALRYFLALGLIALDDADRNAMAWEQLEIALELEPRDAFETGVRAEAAQLLALRDDRHAATAWAGERMSH